MSKHPKFQVFTALTDGWKSECGTCAGPQLPSVPARQKGTKSPHYRRSHSEMVEDAPDERAKDSVIDYLRSLPSCQDDHHVTY